MRAAVFRNGNIVTDTIPDPVPAAGQVLAKTLACGICGSDLHARETDSSEPLLGVLKELSLQYVYAYTPEEYALALHLIAEGQVDASAMVTATTGLDGVAQAFSDLANPERHTKIIIQPDLWARS